MTLAPKADTASVSIVVNGVRRELGIPAATLLVHFIRDTCGLTGTHIGCDTSNCGACTVRVDGHAVKSCTMLAVQADGAEVQTIESLSKYDDFGELELHPLQLAFAEEHALQCGFCTPGMIMTALDVIEDLKDLDEETVRRELEGNLCRCTGYQGIVSAVMIAAHRMSANPVGSREWQQEHA